MVSRLKCQKVPVSTLLDILKRPFYYGLMRHGGECHQGKYEPLITKELFDKVQEVLEKRGKNHEVRKHHFYNSPCALVAVLSRENAKKAIIIIVAPKRRGLASSHTPEKSF